MSHTIQLKVFVNSDLAHLVWQTEKRIPQLLGFALEKRSLDHNDKVIEESFLKSWIGFPGRQEEIGEHRPTTQWPIQEFQWSDHSALYNERVSYRVIPVIGTTPDNVKPSTSLASEWSAPRTLNGQGTSGARFEAYFNRGIVASQWLNRILIKMNAKHPASALDELVSDTSDKTRKFLGGGLRHAMLDLMDEVHKTAGMKVYLCIYEMDDPELIESLKKLGKKAHLLLGNGTHTQDEVDENARSRQKLKDSSVNVYDRIITSSSVLAHNKFMVFTKSETAVMAWTGSTNWTKSGLCTQCNNGLLIHDETIAAAYLTEWHKLKELGGDTGKELRKFNSELCKNASVTFQEPGNGKVTIQQWFSPIEKEADLDQARELIANAQHGILFLMFNPGPEGTLYNAIVDAAKNPHKNLHIEGVINQDPSTATHPVELLHRGHIDSITDADVVLPAALDGFPDHWVKELKMKRGAHAMIHSKCIVVDPFTDNPVVITGSHNLGPKASKQNDDNMVIIRGSKALAHAYAVNIMAIYIHYRWRYHSSFERPGEHAFSTLTTKDSWQDPFLTPGTEKKRELQFWFGQVYDRAGRTPTAIHHIDGDDSDLVNAVANLEISSKPDDMDGDEDELTKKPRRRAHKVVDEPEEKPAPHRRVHKDDDEPKKAKPMRSPRARRGEAEAYYPEEEEDEGDEDYEPEPEQQTRRKTGAGRGRKKADADSDDEEDEEPEKPVRRKAGAAHRKKKEEDYVEEDEDEKPEKPARRKGGATHRKKKEVDYAEESEDEEDEEPEKPARRKAGAAHRKKRDDYVDESEEEEDEEYEPEKPARRKAGTGQRKNVGQKTDSSESKKYPSGMANRTQRDDSSEGCVTM